MVGARSTAMAFNRIADRRLRCAESAHAARAIPAGLLSVGFVWAFTVSFRGAFFVGGGDAESAHACCWRRSRLRACCFILIQNVGLCFLTCFLVGVLSIAPTGAWIAVRGTLDSPVPLLLSLVVMLWTAGFDVLYACQDYEFDVRAGLHSIPRRFGIARSLLIARLFHVGAFAPLLALYWITQLGVFALVGVIGNGRFACLSAPAGARR